MSLALELIVPVKEFVVVNVAVGVGSADRNGSFPFTFTLEFVCTCTCNHAHVNAKECPLTLTWEKEEMGDIIFIAIIFTYRIAHMRDKTANINPYLPIRAKSDD